MKRLFKVWDIKKAGYIAGRLRVRFGWQSETAGLLVGTKYLDSCLFLSIGAVFIHGMTTSSVPSGASLVTIASKSTLA